MMGTDWLTCADPAPMLQFLHGKASDRQLRLFAVARYRSPRVWQHFRGNKWVKDTVWATEQMADGQGDVLVRGAVRL
jgi:hypothetical protein